MANEKRLIDANQLKRRLERFEEFMVEFGNVEAAKATRAIINGLKIMPTVDAVPVDDIRVDIERICLEDQEAILNVSICRKQNEVKIPFSKDVAEVVHGRWEKAEYHGFLRCSECKDVYIDDTWVADGKWNYCPNCGAKKDGDGNA